MLFLLPRWIGVEPTTVHVQEIHHASVAPSLLAAFIAMLSNQGHNRYTQIKMRVPIVELDQL